jgi:DNA-binding PucR family transcriptional regulator
MSRTENGQARSLESVRAVVDRLRARRDEIAQAIYAHIQEVVPNTVGGRDPTYQAGMLAAVTAVLDYCLEAIEHGPAWSEPIPVEAGAQARRAARAGVSVGAVLRRYVAGHRRLGEFVAEETTRLGFSSNESALHHIRRTQEALLERLTAAIEHEYDQERQRIGRSPEQRRVELVRRLLDGESVRRADLADLGYDLDAWHVGVIATGVRATEALEILKADDHQLLPVSNSEETVWAWLGGQRELAHADMERLRLDSEPTGVSLAVGEPARGIEGWRETHHQAQEALQVVLLGRQKRARYADIAVLTPWLEDPDRARSLIELYLSPLEDLKDGGAVSRQMLRAYFQAGRIVSAAACQLGVDRRTLAYRLRTTEECLGYQLEARLPALEIALRLHDLLNGQDCTNWKKSAPRISTLA